MLVLLVDGSSIGAFMNVGGV